MPIIPAFWSQRQKNGEFEAILDRMLMLHRLFLNLYQILLAQSEEAWKSVLPNKTVIFIYSTWPENMSEQNIP
jgi:hypothetical protein